MTFPPLISVVIPTYNYADYILAALTSVSEQSFTNWECIIVDDGSTDDTRVLVEDFIARHPEQVFRYVYMENSGTSAAKNSGIDLSRGKYIQFLDADDMISKDKLTIQSAIIESIECALVFSESIYFKEEQGGQEQSVERFPAGFLASGSLVDFDLLHALIKNNVITISSPLVHKELLLKAGKFPQDLKNNEDWLLWFRIALWKPIFIFDADGRSFVKIRIHYNSAMRSQENMFLGEVVVRKEMDALLRNLDDLQNSDTLMDLNMDLLALHRVRSLEWTKGWNYILTSFIKHPVQRAPLFVQGLFKTGVRIMKQIVPQHGA
jgi:glycosyltransferase involved in cell wall biosynthesis